MIFLYDRVSRSYNDLSFPLVSVGVALAILHSRPSTRHPPQITAATTQRQPRRYRDGRDSSTVTTSSQPPHPRPRPHPHGRATRSANQVNRQARLAQFHPRSCNCSISDPVSTNAVDKLLGHTYDEAELLAGVDESVLNVINDDWLVYCNGGRNAFAPNKVTGEEYLQLLTWIPQAKLSLGPTKTLWFASWQS